VHVRDVNGNTTLINIQKENHITDLYCKKIIKLKLFGWLIDTWIICAVAIMMSDSMHKH